MTTPHTTFPDVHHLNTRDIDLAISRGDHARLEQWVRDFVATRQERANWRVTQQRLEAKITELHDVIAELRAELRTARGRP